MSDTGDILSVSSEDEIEEVFRGNTANDKSHESVTSDACNGGRCYEQEESAETTSSTGVVSVGGDDNIDREDASDPDDCEIVSVESTRGEEKWRDVQGPFKMLNALIQAGYSDPHLLLVRMFGLSQKAIPEELSEQWGLLLSLLMEPTPRPRLRHVNTLEKVIELLSACQCILVVTGAGVSVSCGIPDFRSRDGIYARLAQDYPDLTSPQAMFDMSYFSQNPSPFFKFAKEIFPGQFTPSLTHRFVALLESKGKLLRNYTQNIDTLEQVAGITRLIQCHGSFATATCTTCGYRVPGDCIKDSVFSQNIPYCPQCRPSKTTIKLNGVSTSSSTTETSSPSRHVHTSKKNEGKTLGLSFGVLKPDIVFFGEDLSSEFHDTLASDVDKADLVLVIGSSLKVRPVAHIPNSIPEDVPQVLINRESLSNHDFDVELLGDCDVVVSELCARLGWELSPGSDGKPRSLVPLQDIMSKRINGESSQKSPVTSPNISPVPPVNGPVDDDTIHDDTSSKTAPLDATPFGDTSVGVTSSVQRSRPDVIEVDDSEDESRSDDLWDVAAFLPPNSFTHIPPNQYVFPGAEIFISQSEITDCPSDSPSGSNIASPTHPEETLTHAQLVANTLPMRVSVGSSVNKNFLHQLLRQSNVVSPHEVQCSDVEEDSRHTDQVVKEIPAGCTASGSSQRPIPCSIATGSPTHHPSELSTIDTLQEQPTLSSPNCSQSPLPQKSPETTSAPELKRIRTDSSENQGDNGDF